LLVNFGVYMRRAAIIVILLLVCGLITGCNCNCMSETSCTPPEDSASASLESSVEVGVSSGVVVQ
jgi:hypothetical protein